MSCRSTLLFLMSLDRTTLFLMSPESTVFVPGSAIAVPDSAASRATNATAMAGDGRLARNLRIVGASLIVCEPEPWATSILCHLSCKSQLSIGSG